MEAQDSNPRRRARSERAAGCAEALAARRAAFDFVRQLATGDFLRRSARTSRNALPLKSTGEPAFALPEVTAELPLDLSPAEECEDEAEERDETRPQPQLEDDPAQLSLLCSPQKSARRVTPNTAGFAFLVTPILR